MLYCDGQAYFPRSTALRQTHPAEFLLPLDIWHDQKRIWTSPARFTQSDVPWMLPLAAATGLLIGTDHHSMTLIHSDPANRNRSSLISDAGLAAFAGGAIVSYGLGKFIHDDHARETGILGAEAMADSFAVVEALKIVTSRQRPDINLGHGLFERGSPLNSSFPSEHSALAWSEAAILAREYPGPLTQWGAYGLASLVSLSRITAEKHFPSDVLVGAAAGYLIGRFVYKKHHDDSMTIGPAPLRVPISLRVPIPWSEASTIQSAQRLGGTVNPRVRPTSRSTAGYTRHSDVWPHSAM